MLKTPESRLFSIQSCGRHLRAVCTHTRAPGDRARGERHYSKATGGRRSESWGAEAGVRGANRERRVASRVIREEQEQWPGQIGRSGGSNGWTMTGLVLIPIHGCPTLTFFELVTRRMGVFVLL